MLRGLIFWGLSDLVDLTATQRAGIVGLTLAAFAIDHGYIQKDRDLLPNMDRSITPVVTLVQLALGAGILACEEKSATPVMD